MASLSPARRGIWFVCLILTTLVSVRCQSADPRESEKLEGRGALHIGIDDVTGLPAMIVSRVNGQERCWLSGPVSLIVSNEASQKQETVSGGYVPAAGNCTGASMDLASLGISLSQCIQVEGNRAVWEMTFSGDAKRTGHAIQLELPLVFPKACIFTPGQYGVMDVDAYPTFQPVAYATYSWNDGQSYVLPLVSVMDPAKDSALTLALPPDVNIPHLQVAWSGARVLCLRMEHRGIGGGRPTTIRLLLYAHPADYRSVLKAYAEDFPAYFRPPLARGPYEGTFWYHHILDHPDFNEMARQHVRCVWSSFWFTHMGEFLPEVKEWYPYTYARWWNRKEKMSDDTINAFIRKMHDHGIGTYAYFNVTEYGGAGGERGDTADADRVLKEKLASALVRDEAGRTVPTWEGSKVINPGQDYPYRPVLVEQIRRHLARIPEFDGFMVDRLDWASGFDYGHDDGLSMAGKRPMENLAVPVADAVRVLCRLAHEAGKRVFVNQFWRVELVRDTDGYCHENDYLPAMAYLAPFRPASAWHERRGYAGDLLPFEAQMKRRLHWALFPQMIAHEFPISQQPPNARSADLMELFAPLFEPLMGKEQVLSPHCVAVTGSNDANLFKNGRGFYVAPVTSRVRFLCRPPQVLEQVELTLRVPDAGELCWAHVYSADVPPYGAAIEIREGEAVVKLRRHGTSSVVLAGKGLEPPLEEGDAYRLDRVRRQLFPGVAKKESAPARPEIQDVVQVEIEISAAPVGTSYPCSVTRVLVDGRRVGEMRDAQNGFKGITGAEIPKYPPIISLVPGDDGTWLVPEKVELIVWTKENLGFRAASWEPGDACGAEGSRGLRLPLNWRKPAPVVRSTARFEAKDVQTSGSWLGKFGRYAFWMPGVREGEVQSGFGMQVMMGRGHAWAYWVRGDQRVLQNPLDANASPRATCWFNPECVEIRIVPADHTAYRLTLYLLDYDHAARTQKAALLSGQEILDEREVSALETGQGVYLSWKVAGPVVIRTRKIAGANAVISGVFVDPL